jgi:cytochrome c553
MRLNRTARVLAVAFLASSAVCAAIAQDVASDQDTVRRALHVCAACHGDNGRSPQVGVPALAGQMPQYLVEQLKDFRSQTRVEAGTRAYMWGVSALLDDATIRGLADYFGAQTPAAGRPGNPALLRLGRQLFTEGDRARGVRACAACHGDHAEGQAAFPRLAGQQASYVLAQLKGFSGRLRPHGVVMKVETSQMTEAEMRAVAAYVQSL